MSGRARWLLLLVLLVVAGIGLVVGFRSDRGIAASRGQSTSSASPAPPTGARTTSSVLRAPRAPASSPQTSGPTRAPPSAVVDEGYPVNLEAIRAQIPANSYWTDSAPTEDLEVRRRREAAAAGWNELYGKVLSGTASDAEIRRYFDHRRRVSEDAIEFAELVLADHGAELPERDRGLLELAVDMHRTRLAELPREESEARARKAEQDRRRAEWKGAPTP